MILPKTPSRSAAPDSLGAFVFSVFLLFLPSCRKSGTPEWDHSEAVPPEEQVEAPVFEEFVLIPDTTTPEPEASDKAHFSLRFINYNVQNWLTMDRYHDGKTTKNTPKPDEQKNAVVSLLARHRPDVIGLCEIGTAEDLAEVQELLKAAGGDLPHLHYTGGTDPVRHLGLLSRFPITSTAKPENTRFRLNGTEHGINRSILDATVTAHGKPYRFLGVHLKSKREVKEYDQEQFRVHEARLLREHVDAILEKDADARLIVYGDFNDTRPTRTVSTITGQYNSPGYLTALPAKDRNGHAWTHHWAPHDIYSRIDFITVSRALRRELDFRASRIIDDEEWNKASDHRPILALFR